MSTVQEPRRRSVAQAVADHYRSVDSAPPGFSVSRPVGDQNGFLVTFAALSLGTLLLATLLFRVGVLNGSRDLILYRSGEGSVALPVRFFLITFFATIALYAHTSTRRRVALLASLVGKFVAACAVIDLGAWLLARQALEVGTVTQELLAFLCGLAILPHTLLRQAQLPGPFASPVHRAVPWTSYGTLAVALTVSVVASVWVEREFLAQIVDLRELGLLGGIGPGVFLAQQVFILLLVGVGYRLLRRTRATAFAPEIAILIPAHNEAHGIASTIAAVDRAAASYDGGIHIYVVDNRSQDDTMEVARRAIADCSRVTGEVLYCDIPGKAVALNYGLAHIRQEFVVRIDADTVIGDGCLATAMRHFADPSVGAVGGLPLPAERRTFIDRVRLVEVLLRHGYFQVALGGFGAILGVPGMFAVYRREAIRAVNGTTEGMNGEDTDICIRMNAAGYRTLSDPHAVYYSETPADFAHLREQRTRWFRSIYHLAAHSSPILFNRHAVGGSVVLPFMLVSAARRAMLAPLLIYAVLVLVVFDGAYSGLAWQPIAAVVIGMPTAVAVVACLLLRRPDALVDIPAYLVFRVIRSYFTLGAVLSLAYQPAVAFGRGRSNRIEVTRHEFDLPVVVDADGDLVGSNAGSGVSTR